MKSSSHSVIEMICQRPWNGDFGFDALSPDGSLMYLIQIKSGPNGTGLDYDVRALDAATGRLYPGSIVDRREPDEKMTGIPMTRVGSDDASWAYTLYSESNGGTFVHALHTTAREAFCIDVKLAIDAMMLGAEDRADTIIIASCDSDLDPVVEGLLEMRRTSGVRMRSRPSRAGPVEQIERGRGAGFPVDRRARLPRRPRRDRLQPALSQVNLKRSGPHPVG